MVDNAYPNGLKKTEVWKQTKIEINRSNKIEKLEELDKTKLKKIENLDKMDVIKNDNCDNTFDSNFQKTNCKLLIFCHENSNILEKKIETVKKNIEQNL